MRAFIAVTFILWISAAPVAFAGDIALELDFHNASSTDVGIGDPPRIRFPFSEPWMLKGVEEPSVIGDAGTGWSRRPESKHSINSEELNFSNALIDIWSFQPEVHCCWKGALGAPALRTSVLPPFNSRWLLDELWPRTRCCIDGAAAEPEVFSGSLATDD